MVRLSIIIPFYNVEQYIAQCLDSVYQQDIPEEEYEVICVNDASPDNSRDIVKEYQKKHKNLILVEHEVNKKLGAARNTGRREAQGKYIWNVDSDDMIAPNCLKEMLEICEKNELDVLMFGVKFLREGMLVEREVQPWIESTEPVSGQAFWKKQGIINQGCISPVWTQMYRRAYLDEQQIFSPEINMSEDVPYTYASILFAQKMMVSNTPYYIYRDNQSSLTRELRKTPRPIAVYENSFVSGKHMYELSKRFRYTNELIHQSVEQATQYIILFYMEYAKSLSLDGRRELRNLCLRNMLRNTFVYKVLSHKQAYYYTMFVLFGMIQK